MGKIAAVITAVSILKGKADLLIIIIIINQINGNQCRRSDLSFRPAGRPQQSRGGFFFLPVL